MHRRAERIDRTAIIVALLAAAPAAFFAPAGARAEGPDAVAPTKGTQMAKQARGGFEVKLHPLDPYNDSPEAKVGRMSIDKQFHGDLEATSKGEMISASTDVKASAGYVAIERVTGTLQGRSGSFTLQHNATMTRGAPYLNIVVVPDSATGQLQGLDGRMAIHIDGGRHSYEFDYTLPDTAEAGQAPGVPDPK